MFSCHWERCSRCSLTCMKTELSSHASVCAGKNLTCENRSVVVNMLAAFFHRSNNCLLHNVCFTEKLPMIADTRPEEIRLIRVGAQSLALHITAVGFNRCRRRWENGPSRERQKERVAQKPTWQRSEVPGESEVLSFSRTLRIPGYLLKRRNFINPSGSAFRFFISPKPKPSNHYITALLWMARANLTGEKLLYTRSR